jgi:1,4-dihydroxy-2-naphthoate octaprenyltransferase
VRDVATDAATGKRTLAVRLGDRRARLLYVGVVVVAFGAIVPIALDAPWALLALAAVPLAIAPCQTVLTAQAPPELVRALIGTARLQLVTATLLAVGLWIG